MQGDHLSGYPPAYVRRREALHPHRPNAGPRGRPAYSQAMQDGGDRAAKGRRLEERIGGLFAEHGYAVQLNARREGVSGARHEIDVLATRADALTESSTFIECKAWDVRIPKDVVAKARYVMQDAGINHGIIVALEGWTLSAEQAAGEAGIELWGPDELAERLGAQALGGLKAAPSRQAVGFPATVPRERAERVLAAEARGVLVSGRRRLARVGLLWTPWHLLRLSVSSEKGAVRKRIVSERVVNLYDGIEGSVLIEATGEPTPEPVDIAGGSLRAELGASAIAKQIRDSLSRHRSVSTGAARERHARRLAALGVPLPVSAVTVEDQATIHLPFWVAVIRGRSGDRVAATSALEPSAVHRGVSNLLTGRIAAVDEALAANRADRPPAGEREAGARRG